MAANQKVTKTVSLASGELVPALGMGTWKMGDAPSARAEELATLRRGLDLGVTLIDTAEMYGEGRAETLIGEALAGRRDAAFIVSKVYPHNADRRGCVAACERSLKRLNTDRLDLYLLHWRGEVPLEETLEAFQALKSAGKIRHYGVSNLDTGDMQELGRLAGGTEVQANQVLYSPAQRGIEWDLLAWLRERRVAVMAYSPLDEGRLLRHREFGALAARFGRTPAQLALAWLLARDGVIAIPKTSQRARLEENVAALEKPLSADEAAALDAIFPPPKRKSSLQMY
jgi:diketogulonate reductase-like aldo/keto reductase